MLRWSIKIPGATVEVRSTSVSDGDFAVARLASSDASLPSGQADGAEAGLPERYAAIVDRPWTWLRQVHGADLVAVHAAGDSAGAIADGALTWSPLVPIAVTTADCSPVVLVSSQGVAVVHAGWKGARLGIIEAAAQELTSKGGVAVATVLGPCIGVDHYEFGRDDLASMVAAYGDAVVGTTASGQPALNMHNVVSQACLNAGWPAPEVPPCTSSTEYFSHRCRSDLGRQTTVAWIEPNEGTA